MTNIIRLFVFILFYSLTMQTHAVEIVRLQIDYSGSLQTLDIELHDDVAPLTVANYLNYVNSGRYNGTFIYRNVPGFVLQTGGFTFKPNDPLNDPLRPIAENTGLELVPKDATVTNEFNLSNIRGTISLAKIDGDPNSGSSEWFISLNDNSANLDNQNGGFTVFGTVIDDGMIIADEISAFPKHPTAGQVLGSSFSDLPVVDYPLNILPPVLRENLVMIPDISPISRPIVRITPNDGSFGLDVAGDAIEELLNINLKNKGNEELKIDSIDTTNLTAPFSINSDACTTNNLQPVSTAPLSSCDIVISFSPTVLGLFSGSIVISYSSTVDMATHSVTYNVFGEGVVDFPVVSGNQTSIDFGGTIINTSSNRELTLTNIGGDIAEITDISLTGVDTDLFSISNTGCSIGTMLQIEETCAIELTFNPDSTGDKTAILNVQSNNNSLIIGIAGTGTKPVITFPQSFDVGIAQVNQTVQELFLITNSGTGNLTLTNISISGADSSFFTQDNDCPDTNNTALPTKPIDPTGGCVFQINYTPTSSGSHSALLSIQSTDPDTPLVNINLTGKTDIAVIQGPTSVDIGTSQVNGIAASTTITITNAGKAPLVISDITGLNLTDFTQQNNCIDTSIQINQDESCSILVTYSAQSIGNSLTTMTIVSNDSLNNNFDILLSGFGDNDIDGILSEVELSGPNSGDGNNDEISDEIQNNVSTFKLINGEYVTLISDNSILLDSITTLFKVAASDLDVSIQAPEGISLDRGVISYNIQLPPGDAVNVGILLPTGAMPESYNIYGPTSDNTSPHWYNFSFDTSAQLGADFIGRVSIESPSGDSYSANMVIIRFIDGGKGDDDLIANGVIQHKIGILGNLENNSSSGSGALSYLFLLFVFISRISRKLMYVDS